MGHALVKANKYQKIDQRHVTSPAIAGEVPGPLNPTSNQIAKVMVVRYLPTLP